MLELLVVINPLTILAKKAQPYIYKRFLNTPLTRANQNIQSLIKNYSTQLPSKHLPTKTLEQGVQYVQSLREKHQGRSYSLLYINFENFGIHIFCVHLKFFCRCCLAESIFVRLISFP